MEAQKIIKRVLAGLGVVIIAGYSMFVLEDFILGPQITILAPEAARESGVRYFGYATTSALIEIRGRATHARILTLNGLVMPQDIEGNFSEPLLLASGYNIMSIRAVDRYGRSTEKKIEMTLLVNNE